MALAGPETVSTAGMSEGKVGWMVLAAASALLWELGSGTGFMWRRGLVSWAPGSNLEGVKAVRMHGRCMMQMMDDINLNIFTRTTKHWQCQNFSIQASEQTWNGICEYTWNSFILPCASNCR